MIKGEVRPVLKDAYQKLLQGGHKLTPQRWAILNVFYQSPGHHLAAEEVRESLRRLYPKEHFGLATVYRTVELYTDLGILRRLEFGDGRSRYELAATSSPHYHLVCTRCGQVEEVSDRLLQSLEETLLKDKGFQVLEYTVQFRGLCSSCRGV